jgi:hypothetical protein
MDTATDTITDWAIETVQLTEQERVCFEKINALRAQAGLMPFILCPDLVDQSRKWSANLSSRGYLYHGAAQEICAQTNSECGERAFHLWNHSPAHRAFLYRSGTKVGIGNVGNFWTMRGESAVQEWSSASVRQDGGRQVFAEGFYYVPSGESLPDYLSAASRPVNTIEPTAASSTLSAAQERGSVSPHVDRFYYVPTGESPSDFLSIEWRAASTVERPVPRSTQNVYRPSFFRRVR